jgi:hypothetical protein
MDIHKITLQLNKIQQTLERDKTIQEIAENLKENQSLDLDDKINVKNELLYQENNDEYKELISQFSKAYLELCEFYVGPELPGETYLDSKKNMMELILLFIFFAMWEPYINAYYETYCLPKI